MQIYLLRNATAVERGSAHYPNDDRPLTADGRKRFKRMAANLGRALGKVNIVISSPLSRAKETAKILQKSLSRPAPLKCDPLFSAGSSVPRQVKYLMELSKHRKIVVVGHEPELSELAAALIGAEINLDFKKGAICRIDLPASSTKRGVLKWFLSPKIIKRVAND